ncbi:MAG: hypothetical protein ACI9HJ_001549, partial [Ulvibacter sp.]
VYSLFTACLKPVCNVNIKNTNYLVLLYERI